MCGRFTLRTLAETIASLFNAIPRDGFACSARYNIAPTQSVPVISERDGHRELSKMHWGLIPSWSKEPKANYGTAPSGEMFADDVRLNGLKLLAAHHVEEGIPACADYIRTQNPWDRQDRTPKILEQLLLYGAYAQTVIPRLSETAEYFERGEPDFPKQLSLRKASAVHEAIKKIQSSSKKPTLKQINP